MFTMFFDTETTGKNPKEAHLVQLALVIDDEQRNTVVKLSTLIQCPVEIPEEAARIHGKSKAICDELGLKPETAVHLFWHYASRCKTVAHNAQYDRQIMETAAARFAPTILSRLLEESFCTLQASTPICKLPGRPGSYKWPTLNEAYRLIVNPDGFEGAHDALADTLACREVYYALLNRKENT